MGMGHGNPKKFIPSGINLHLLLEVTFRGKNTPCNRRISTCRAPFFEHDNIGPFFPGCNGRCQPSTASTNDNNPGLNGFYI
jgi:hypothetical protein